MERCRKDPCDQVRSRVAAIVVPSLTQNLQEDGGEEGVAPPEQGDEPEDMGVQAPEGEGFDDLYGGAEDHKPVLPGRGRPVLVRVVRVDGYRVVTFGALDGVEDELGAAVEDVDAGRFGEGASSGQWCCKGAAAHEVAHGAGEGSLKAERGRGCEGVFGRRNGVVQHLFDTAVFVLLDGFDKHRLRVAEVLSTPRPYPLVVPEHHLNGSIDVAVAKAAGSRSQSGIEAARQAFVTWTAPKVEVGAHANPAVALRPCIRASAMGAPMRVATAATSVRPEPTCWAAITGRPSCRNYEGERRDGVLPESRC
ncbi:hypothetical protein GP486_005778 [Trichoglossum hirsutum]|uniref:Uncharacterized protein n=1 Tax=Trichoglossum hirsutum TaxID=265104 RepID=A0A9P8RLL8_9PEZI|nr:hypothetical protein GP486_005778 [Trichoglossum hirsutum]